MATPSDLSTVQTLAAKVGPALTNNTTFLALASPTTAQVTAQVQALTRQMNAIMRLLANRFESTTDT